ncbi:hypothetical protein PGB90_005159 [Kerria lacca]
MMASVKMGNLASFINKYRTRTEIFLNLWRALTSIENKNTRLRYPRIGFVHMRIVEYTLHTPQRRSKSKYSTGKSLSKRENVVVCMSFGWENTSLPLYVYSSDKYSWLDEFNGFCVILSQTMYMRTG